MTRGKTEEGKLDRRKVGKVGKFSVLEYRVGDKVRYCPVEGKSEDGVVSTVGRVYVFVMLGQSMHPHAISPRSYAGRKTGTFGEEQ